jgi:hypothetical protein
MIGSQLCNTYVVLCETDEPFKAFSGTLSYWYIDGTSFHAYIGDFVECYRDGTRVCQLLLELVLDCAPLIV